MEVRDCRLCGRKTTGSVGAAGIRWSDICQECKDAEDQALLDALTAQAKVLDSFFKEVG